jgi:hypothetical protein
MMMAWEGIGRWIWRDAKLRAVGLRHVNKPMSLLTWNSIAVLSGLCLGCLGATSATELDFEGIGAGLYARRDDLAVENPTASYNVKADRFGFLLSERVHPRLSLGLLGGIAATDTEGQAITDGMQLSGNYVGVYLAGTALEGQRWSIGYDASLFYQSVEDKRDGQRVELDWLESGAAVRVGLRLTAMVSLYAGPYYRSLDIDQRASGAVNATTRFSEQDSLDAVVGVALEIDPGGFIDLAVHRGASDGFILTFRRQY